MERDRRSDGGLGVRLTRPALRCDRQGRGQGDDAGLHTSSGSAAASGESKSWAVSHRAALAMGLVVYAVRSTVG